MKLSPSARIVMILFLSALAIRAQTEKAKLLPTESAARRVQAIRTELDSQVGGDKFEAYKAQHEQLFNRWKQVVATFVMAQLEAEPELDQWQLRDQLMRVLGIKRADMRDDFHETPLVFPSVRYPVKDPAVWAVVYEGDIYNGAGGARVVVESYVVEKGKARLAGRGGAEMNGYALRLGGGQIYNPNAGSVSVLTHATAQWSSGHVLPAAAALYAVGPTGVKTLWKLTAPGIEFVGQVDSGFVIQYHDEDRHSANMPSSAIDLYMTDHETPRRIGHHFNGE
jgi:hypothetical protein